jgi:oxygen-independent coproporphyrinogen-3 oxidase
MYALPQQTPEEALEDVRTACALSPAHISYYQLTLEPGTVFHARPPQLPDEDAAWQIQSAGQALWADAGYVQYEVSAYARDGRRCRHNINYWLFGDYLGIGAGAHGKLSFELPGHILRTTKPKQPREYQEQVRRAESGARDAGSRALIGESALIDAADLPFEFMLNALRLNEGFTLSDYRRRTGLDMDSIAAKLAQAEGRGLLIGPAAGPAGDRAAGWRPSELGRRFLNDLQASFLA